MFDRLKSIFCAMCYPAYVAMRRNWMGDKHRQELKTRRERDAEINTLSAPPEYEDIRLVCLWAVEYYPPSYTEDLVAGLDKLGWAEPTFHSDPVFGIEKMRERHSGGRMMPLGYLVPKKSTRSFEPMTRVARLPGWVDYAIADLYVTPSLNCVVVCFVLKEEAASRFDRALRVNYHTQAIPGKGGWQYELPDRQKAQHIAETRRILLESVSSWFEEHLPGLCSSGLLYGEMPTCEGITTRVAEPFAAASEGDEALAPYTSMMGIGQDFDAWKCRESPMLKLRFPSDRCRRWQYHSILATKELPHADTRAGGQLIDAEDIQPTHTLVSPWLTTWALMPLLQGYVRLVRDVRDSPVLRGADRKCAASTLKRLRGYLAYSIDIADVASELSAEPVGRFLAARSVPFGPRNNGNGRPSLLDFLSGRIMESAAGVLEREKALRDQIVQIGSLLGTEENIRAQTKIRHMTWWIIFLSVAAIGLAAFAFIFDFYGFLANLGT